MSIKSFLIALLIGFIVYEIIAIPLGVYKKKKQQKKLEESEDNENVSN